MKLSAILAPLIAAKASHATIMEVVMAFEAQQEAMLVQIDEGREKARARWHKWKDSKRLQTFANDSRARDLENKQTNKEDKEVAPPAAAPSRRGSRIPADFQPDIAAAIAEGISRSQAELQARSFVDYWTAKPGAAACKLDWPATWRVWYRRSVKATSPPPRQANGVVAAAQRMMEGLNGTESIFGDIGDVELVSAKPVHEPGRVVEDLRGGVGRRYGGSHH